MREHQSGISEIWFRSPARVASPCASVFSSVNWYQCCLRKILLCRDHDDKKGSWHLTLGTYIKLLPLSCLKRELWEVSPLISGRGAAVLKHLQADPSLPVRGVWRDSPSHSLGNAPEETLLGFSKEKIVQKIRCSLFVSDPNTLIFKIRIGEKFFLFSIQFVTIHS